jgi:3',5'-cyclic AMP phosphodiesterase CpdA
MPQSFFTRCRVPTWSLAPCMGVMALLALLLGPAPSPAGAQDRVAPSDPALVPRRVVLTWRDDPARTQAVTWRTDGKVDEAFAEIAEAGANPRFGATARRSPARTTPVPVDDTVVYYHEARFSALRPATQYAYRVGDGETWSEWFHFRTASTDPDPFSFIYLGDAQNDIRSLWSRAIRSAFMAAPHARFVLHAGDLVNVGESDREWGEWFSAGGWLNAMIPQVPAVGNHEYGRLDRDDSGELSRFWRPQFALPEDGPEGLTETVYAFDYQGVRVIVLNSQRDDMLAEQAAWLEARLKDNRNRWTVVAFHHPVFSLATTRDNPRLRDAWKPLFDAYGVDLVLQGHDHTYGRGQNLAEGTSHREDGGPVYVVSVSGPKMYEVGQQRDWATRRGANLQLYQIISVSNQTLRYEARTVTGELFDAFEIAKDRRGRRTFSDHTPSVAPSR